jgi:hypothetical protein
MATITPTTTSNNEEESWEEGGISDLTDVQQIILSVAVIPSSLLSLFGSTIILYNVVYRKHLQSPLERILFGLSMGDILVTFNWMLAAFLTPPVHGRTTVAFGNEATCVTLGTMSQLSVLTFFYNASLALYYMMSIVYDTKDTQFTTQMEPWLHGVALLFAVGTASVGSSMEFFNPVGIGMGCWVVDVPFNCGDDPWETGEPCMSRYIGWAFGGLPIIVCFFTVVLCMTMIYCRVREQYKRSEAYSLRSNRQQQRLQEVFIRCLSYVTAFWMTSISTVIVRLLETYNYPITEEAKLFPLLLAQSILLPITGFCNMLIFIRPRYLNWSSDFPEQPRRWAMVQALWNDTEQRYYPNNSSDGLHGSSSHHTTSRRFVVKSKQQTLDGPTQSFDNEVVTDDEMAMSTD